MNDQPTPEEQDARETQTGSAIVKIAERVLGRLVQTLPARVAKNLLRAADVTLGGGVDIWKEQLASWQAGIKAKSAARTEAWLAAGHAAGAAMKGDPELGLRAANHLLGSAINDQQRREDVVKEAARNLHEDPPTSDADKDIDEDWLLRFSRIAEQVSKKEMQIIMGGGLGG